MKNYTFNTFNYYAENGIAEALKEINIKNKNPIIVCVGTDLVVGDSLGPLVGTFLKKKNLNAYIYGTLNLPITAKEVEYAGKYLSDMHPNSTIIAIDAAVGVSEDVGLIKVNDSGIKPGLGVNKDLPAIGDVSIIGVVSEKSEKNVSLYNLTRLNLVYRMAEKISCGIENYIKSYTLNAKKINSTVTFGA